MTHLSLEKDAPLGRAYRSGFRQTNEWKMDPSPSADAEDDALAKRLLGNWASPASHRGRSPLTVALLRAKIEAEFLAHYTGEKPAHRMQAVLIARQIPGVPVKMVWSREEDMAHGRYHPVTMAKLTGALADRGNLTALHMRLSGQSILITLRPQAMVNGIDPLIFQGLAKDDPEKPTANDQATCCSVPNLLIEHAMRNPPVPPRFWRGVNVNQNAIYIECFMDELAAAAKVDALEFRRRLLSNQPKARAVLEAVGWGGPMENRVMGRGLALFRSFGSYTAALAEVSVNGGKLKAHRSGTRITTSVVLRRCTSITWRAARRWRRSCARRAMASS